MHESPREGDSFFITMVNHTKNRKTPEELGLFYFIHVSRIIVITYNFRDPASAVAERHASGFTNVRKSKAVCFFITW